MSRYIEADALMNFFVDIPDNFTLTIGNLRATVKGAPSIDIVRCGECAKRMTDDCPMCNECNSGKVSTEDDDFCSYGEREDQ